jgi:hypothetical protein
MSNRCSFASRRKGRLLAYVSAGVLASMAPVAAQAAVLSNPICPNNSAQFDPGSGQGIVVPPGFKISVFASGLNFLPELPFAGPGQGSKCTYLNRATDCRAYATMKIHP